MLANVLAIERAVGGCVPNTLINLARMKTGIPLTAVGRMGDDEGGRFILNELAKTGADTENIHIIPGGITGFSDVMTKITTGERAFSTAGAKTPISSRKRFRLNRSPAGFFIQHTYCFWTNSTKRTKNTEPKWRAI